MYGVRGQVAEIRLHLEALGRLIGRKAERSDIETAYFLSDYILSDGESSQVTQVRAEEREMGLERHVDRIFELLNGIGKRKDEGIRQFMVATMRHFVECILPEERVNPSFDVSLTEGVRIILGERDPHLSEKTLRDRAGHLAYKLRKDRVLMRITKRYPTNKKIRYVSPDRFANFRTRVYELIFNPRPNPDRQSRRAEITPVVKDRVERKDRGVSPVEIIEQVVWDVFEYDRERELNVVESEVRSFVRDYGHDPRVLEYIERKYLEEEKIPAFREVVRGLLEREITEAQLAVRGVEV
jgi:hypothetical protein